MAESAEERAKLKDLVIRFADAFNRDDLDGVMAFMVTQRISSWTPPPARR